MKNIHSIVILILFFTLPRGLIAQESAATRDELIAQIGAKNSDLKNSFEFLHENKLIDMSFSDFLDKNISDDHMDEKWEYHDVMKKALDIIEASISDSCLWNLSTGTKNFVTEYVASCQQGCVKDIFNNLSVSKDPFAWTQTNNLYALAKIHNHEQLHLLVYLDDSLTFIGMQKQEICNMYEYLHLTMNYSESSSTFLAEKFNLVMNEGINHFKESIKTALILTLKKYASLKINLNNFDPQFREYINKYKNNELQVIFKEIFDEYNENGYVFFAKEDVSHLNDSYYNLIHVVLAYDAVDILEIILVSCASRNDLLVDIINKFYILHNATSYNAENCMKFLIKSGACVDLKIVDESEDLQRFAPLFYARNKESFNILISFGANAHVKNKNNESLLHILKPIDVVEQLLIFGLDVNAQDDSGLTPLHCAAQRKSKNTDLIEKLILNGARVNIQNDRGWTPLHYAINNRTRTKEHDDYVRIKVPSYKMPDENGIIRNVGITCENFVGSIIPLLLSHGADITIADHEGITPLGMASKGQNKSQELFNLMQPCSNSKM